MNFGSKYLESHLTLNYIDEERSEYSNSRFTVEAVRDETHIQFNDLLERQWSIAQHPNQQTGKYYNDITPSSEHRNNSQLKALELEAVKSPRDNTQQTILVRTLQKKQDKISLRSISTVFPTAQKVEDLTLFIKSDYFSKIVQLGVIINLIGLIIFDYSFRVEVEMNPVSEIPTSIRNAISLNLQLFANSIFTLQILIELISSQQFFKYPWKTFNLITTLACWSTIFLDYIYYDEYIFYETIILLRTSKSARIIEVFDTLRNPFEAFLSTVPSLGKIFFPMFIFLLFYAVTGMILFGGATQNRCRQTPVPLSNSTTWPQVDQKLCGSSLLDCPKGFCGNPFKYGLPLNQKEERVESNQYGVVNFNNLLSAALSVYHYAFLSNWTAIKDKFSRFINPYFTAFYFVTCAIFLFFITANLIMISLSKAYEEQEKLKKSTAKLEEEHKEEHEDDSYYEELINSNSVLRYLHYLDIILILIQAIVILIDYEHIKSHQQQLLSAIDFSLTWVSFIIISIRLVLLRAQIFASNLNIIDWIGILFSIADFFYCAAIGQNIVNPSSIFSKLMRSIKFIRIIKLIFISKNMLIYEKKLVKLFFMTLKSMRHFLLLLFSIVLVFSFTGAQMFAYRVRFDKQHHVNIREGKPYVFNFEGIMESMIHVVGLYENERWSETMYSYYYATGVKAIIFFTISIFIVHLMLTRLFIALFLIYFRDKLESGEHHDESQYSHLTKTASDYKSDGSNLEEKYFDEYNKDSIKMMDKISLDQKIFWVFDRDMLLIRFARMISDSYLLYALITIFTAAYCISILIRTSTDSSEKEYTLYKLEKIPIYLYLFELGVGMLGNGLYFHPDSYLKKSSLNVLNLLICFLAILSELPLFDPLTKSILRRFLVLKIFIIFKECDKEMSIIIEAIAEISKKFIRMYGIYMFFLLIACIAPIKIQKNGFYTCYNSYQGTAHAPSNEEECINTGGDWVQQTQSFRNIFTSILLMYQIVSSESWTYFIQKSSLSQPWDFYFVGIFFFYNICLLNIFIGVTVETYIELKNKAFKLNLLKSNQKAWILIKNCINQLVPQPSLEQPPKCSFLIKMGFRIINYRPYEDLIDLLSFLNLIIFAIRIDRSSSDYYSVVHFFDIFFLVIFAMDTSLKLIVLRSSFFYLDNSKIDSMGLCFYIIYGIARHFSRLTDQVIRINESISAIFQILRCKKGTHLITLVLFRFTWSRTLINSILQVLPKCLSIGKLLFTVLFVYVALGLQLFKYVKPNHKIDGYTTGFNNFFTGIGTLLKIASNQSWFDQVSALVRSSAPNDVCFHIGRMEQAVRYGGMGCGSYIAYPFLISFHVLMSLLILNLLIATMVSAYDQNYEKEYNSVNIFQLQKCLSLWQKYDPKGLGVIAFKKFWRLSSEIGILFGISKKKLIKSKQKFLEQLNIGIYYSIDSTETPVLCYKFHDVITRFSMIKLQVSGDKTDESTNAIDFDIDPYIEQEISDYTSKVPTYLYEKVRPYSTYTSGEMKYFFSLLRKMRAWRIAAKFKDSNSITKLTQIIKIAMARRKQQEEIMNLIAKNRKTIHFSSLSDSISRLGKDSLK